MKKFNTNKITEILNNRFAAGIGYNGYKSNFEADGNQVMIYDVDRGPRTDHGGIDGEGWMCPTEINEQYTKYLKRFKSVIELIELTLKDKGYRARVDLDYGEKGHVSLMISEVVKPKRTKKAPKKSTKSVAKKRGVIETIRTAIFAERLTKVEILKTLKDTFPERDADKMSKTINAQLPSRIVKAGQEMDTKKNAAGILTYKLFTK